MRTNIAIKALKPASKPCKKSDSGGLFILVQPNGGKTWRFAYRFEGKQKLLSGGPFPETVLLAARSWREMMKHELALGMDLSQERKKGKVRASWVKLSVFRPRRSPAKLTARTAKRTENRLPFTPPCWAYY